VTPSSLVELYRLFSSACYLSLLTACVMEAVSTTDTPVTSTRLHGVTFQNTSAVLWWLDDKDKVFYAN